MVVVRTTETLWSPDTCKCQIRMKYDYDDAKPLPTFSSLGKIVKGVEHSAAPTDADLLSLVSDEGTRKEKVKAMLAQFKGYDFVQILDIFAFSFDSNRTLQISLGGLSAADKTQLQALVDASPIGSGKVVIT